MTDNEIIKALECCSCESIMYCEDSCPFYKKCINDEHLSKYALDLINRQKAEIERLKGEIDKQYEQAKADILGNMADGGTSCHWCIEQHKAEAVREFAERLKENITECRLVNDYVYQGYDTQEVLNCIDNLLKEKVGDELP